jgi:hypothetical protein
LIKYIFEYIKNYKFRIMNSVAEALNTLISAVNLAHSKGGVYSLEESHYIYLAISYLNSLQNQSKAAAPAAPVAPSPQIVEDDTETEY